jgi:hypothetical protein|nr:hypothetical protein [Kofleriaceae bacterium]
MAGGSRTASAQVWDNHGWTKLGERTVNGKVDHDRIDVGAYDGRFSKLTLVVERDEIELLDFEITFGNGERFHPDVRYIFKEGSRTRAIDLPGDDRVIKNINLKYRNVRGGQAKVEVWGFRDAGGGAHAAAWDSHGWTLLGEREVNGHGREDNDKIEVGRGDGTFTRMAFVVLDNEIELIDVDVKFGNGEHWHPDLKAYFKEGSRSRELDFPGNRRVVKSIDFKYRNVPDGKRAKVAVWAK